MSLNKELNKLSNSLTSNRYSIKSKSPNNIYFSKYISRQNTLENEKDLLYKRIKKTKKIKNNFPLLKKYDSSSNLLNLSLKKNVNSISVQDRRNLKKINKENSIELNKKNSCLTRNTNPKNNFQNSLDNYIGKLNKKIEEYEKNKGNDLFNYKYSKGMIKKNISGLFNLKNGNKLKTNKSTTFLFKKIKPQENILRRLLSIKENNSSLKQAIKSQNIKWLWLHKSFIIEQLIFYFQDYKWFINKNQFINKKILEEFMIITNLKKDKIFVDNIFLLFDYENEGFIDFKKVLFSFIISSNSNYQQKIRLMLNLIKNENDDNINIKDLNNLFIYTIPFNERKFIINLIKDNLTFKDGCLIEDSLIFNFLSSNDKIYNIFKKYFINFDDITNEIDNEINNAYMGVMKTSKFSLFGKDTNTFILNDVKKLENIIHSLKKNMDFKEKFSQLFLLDT